MHRHTAISARENTASHQQSLALRLADYYNEKRFLDSKCIKAVWRPDYSALPDGLAGLREPFRGREGHGRDKAGEVESSPTTSFCVRHWWYTLMIFVTACPLSSWRRGILRLETGECI